MYKQHLRVLIVDDEPELRKTVRSVLESSQKDLEWDFEEASNGLEALNCLKNTEFDLLLMDVRMPTMGGLEALKKIKESHPQTFVVLMTAQANLRDAVESIKEGAYDYLEK